MPEAKGFKQCPQDLVSLSPSSVLALSMGRIPLWGQNGCQQLQAQSLALNRLGVPVQTGHTGKSLSSAALKAVTGTAVWRHVIEDRCVLQEKPVEEGERQECGLRSNLTWLTHRT